jgi:uncharacterized repeat protein (TIGR03803 family)
MYNVMKIRATRLAAAGAVLMLFTALAPCAQAQSYTYSILHHFVYPGGQEPRGDLFLGASNNVYGTTWRGGQCDQGTVFKLDTSSNNFAVLVEICLGFYPYPARPYGGVILDASGKIYGTTEMGGAYTSMGTVFMLDTSAMVMPILHSFNGLDGRTPRAGLILDASGNLYGTTRNGGPSDKGTVFRLDTSGNNFTVLHSFAGGATDGAHNSAGLILDASGNLYGTTQNGGPSDLGTVFKLDTAGNNFTVLHSFAGASDGGAPYAGLILDASGNLYGTARVGGSSNLGTAFKLDTAGNNFTVLHNFAGGASDGANPNAGRMILDASGNLYGTTSSGGSSAGGTVFRLDTSGDHFTVLHTFAIPLPFGAPPAGGVSDGSDPEAGLVMDSAGNLYGTTYAGGSDNEGTLFMLAPVHPTVFFTGAPASAPYGYQFTVSAITNASTTAVIAASGPCSVGGTIVTMTGGAGTCLLTASWGADSNYTATSLTQSTDASPASLTITAVNKTKLLNAANPAFTAGYSGFVSGDGPGSLGGTLNCTSTAGAASPVGSYPITCTGQTSTNYASRTSRARSRSSMPRRDWRAVAMWATPSCNRSMPTEAACGNRAPRFRPNSESATRMASPSAPRA